MLQQQLIADQKASELDIERTTQSNLCKLVTVEK